MRTIKTIKLLRTFQPYFFYVANNYKGNVKNVCTKAFRPLFNYQNNLNFIIITNRKITNKG